ncbi:unnamed protein product [Symbiodinium natans]|uniref:Uncharacterized protein n=1 Tax=Symbiodinium natans TaxID=878477 RepID=A0A812KG87_9DINO|nr:unnamed protein product [Symbiodinium natans]
MEDPDFSMKATSPLANKGDPHQGEAGGGAGCVAGDGPDHSGGKYLADGLDHCGGEAAVLLDLDFPDPFADFFEPEKSDKHQAGNLDFEVLPHVLAFTAPFSSGHRSVQE